MGDGLRQLAPVRKPARIDGDAGKFRQRRLPFLKTDGPVITDCDQCHRFGAVLVDVAALRHAGHDDDVPARSARWRRHRAFVDMAERPIVKAGGVQIGGTARRIGIMARRAAKTGVQDTDVDGVRDRPAIAWQQAFGRGRIGEAEPMDGHRFLARRALDQHMLGPAAKQLDQIRQHQLLRDPGKGVMIAADDEAADTGGGQASQFIRQERSRLHRGLVAVIKIAGDDKRVDALFQAQVDNGAERLPRGGADEAGKVRIAQSQRLQRRIEMDVSGMDETIGGDRRLLRRIDCRSGERGGQP